MHGKEKALSFSMIPYKSCIVNLVSSYLIKHQTSVSMKLFLWM
jgi:hypothetical protein